VVQLWDWAARQAVNEFRAHPGMVYGLAFSPDGKLLATGGNDQLIHLWEAGTTNQIATYQGHEAEIWSLDFSKDGQFLVSASEDGTAKLWSVKSGARKSESFALSPESNPMGFLPDGTALVSKDNGQAVTRLWSLPDGQLIRSNTWHQIEEEGCPSAIFLPANQRVAGVTTNGTVHWWNLTTGEHLSSIPLATTSFEPLIVSQDTRWLLGSHSDTNVALFDLRAARHVRDFADLRMYGDCAAFSPDGRWLACATTNNDIRIWDLAANREKMVFKGHKWWVYSLRFSPDAKLLASGGYDAQVGLWSLETGKALYPPLKGHRSGVIPVVFSADGKTLITGSADRTIRWWSVATGREMLLFQDVDIISRDAISQAELNPGGNLLVWHERQRRIRVSRLPSLAVIDAAEAAHN
jgi:WD40 repeat protein